MSKNLIIIVSVVLLIIIGFGVYFFVVKKPRPEEVVNVNNLPAVRTVEIRNGTALVGKGGELEKKLQSAGFKVDKVGSASNESYVTTLIYLRGDMNAKSILGLVRGSLVSELPIGEEPTTSDILVIIGRDVSADVRSNNP